VQGREHPQTVRVRLSGYQSAPESKIGIVPIGPNLEVLILLKRRTKNAHKDTDNFLVTHGGP
jgi:hypothetical protein